MINESDDRAAIRKLSPREVQVFRALAMGATNHEVAERYVLSVKTVDTHRGHAIQKLAHLGVRNNADIARMALRAGVVAFDTDWKTWPEDAALFLA